MKCQATLLLLLYIFYHVSAARLSFAHKNPPHPDCADHTKYITAEDLDKINRGGYPDGPVIRQHLVCIWKEKGAMSESGILQKNFIKNKIVVGLSRQESRRAAEGCIVQKNEPGETAYAFYRCISPLLAEYNN